MRKQHLKIGEDGERAAKEFLEKKGLKTLETNWRAGRAEIDIIAQLPDQTLVFVEVKTRSDNLLAAPEMAVSARKQALIQRAAFAYMRKVAHDWKFRFDIVAILSRDQQFFIDHFEDAFFPENLE